MSKKTKIVLGVIVGLLVLLGIIAALLYRERINTRPDVAVSRFYTTWIHAAETSSSTPLEQRLHTKSTYVTETFGRDIERAASRGEDAVLCGVQPGAAGLEIEDMRVFDEDKRARVTARLGSEVLYIFLVQDEKKMWRIDEVDCGVNDIKKEDKATSTEEQATSTTQ